MFFYTFWLIYLKAFNARLWRYVLMSERSKIADRLMAHATMCQKAASLCWNEAIAFELEKLADDCRQAAAACRPEPAQGTPVVWKN